MTEDSTLGQFFESLREKKCISLANIRERFEKLGLNFEIMSAPELIPAWVLEEAFQIYEMSIDEFLEFTILANRHFGGKKRADFQTNQFNKLSESPRFRIDEKLAKFEDKGGFASISRRRNRLKKKKKDDTSS